MPKDKERNEKHKLMGREKRAKMTAKALSGEMEPRAWKVCEYCGECYPWFNFYLQHRDSKTCPAWLTGSKCSSKFRGVQVSKANGEREIDLYKPKKTDCRKELCNKTPYCANIGSCLDLEIMTPGTLPLKADGSCKVPVIGVDPKHYRIKGIVYGVGPAHQI